MNKTSYAIIGTGAVGGLYGARLQQAGHDVQFLARSDAAWMAEHGLTVRSIWGDLTLPRVQVTTSSADIPPCDVICVCLKTTSNHLLPELLRPLIRPGTVVVLLQNGLGAEEELATVFPEAVIVGGLCFLCSNKTGPGEVHHIDYGRILLAPLQKEHMPTVKKLQQDFSDAGILNESDPSLREARWKKLIWNIPFNGLCTVLRCETDQLMTDAGIRALSEDLMREVIAGNHACGGKIPIETAAQMMEFTIAMKPYNPSMKLDHEAGRPMEVEYIYQRPLLAARQAGCELPRIEMLARQLTLLDAPLH